MSKKTGKGDPEQPEAAEDESLATTLPNGLKPRAETEPGTPPPPARVRPQTGELLSSAAGRLHSVVVTEAAGTVSLSLPAMPEEQARDTLLDRFTKAGYAIEIDYPFHRGNMLVTLDGYDPEEAVGYQFISHTGADVVTDHGTDVEHELRRLHQQGVAHVLVVHDVSTTTSKSLNAAIDAFLAELKAV